MDGTILSQGSFLSSLAANPIPGTAAVYSASPTIIQIPSAADWVSVRNFTQFGTAGLATARFNGGAGTAVIGREFFWQRGFLPGQAIVKYYTTGGQTLTGDVLNSGGLTIYDPTGLQAGSQPLYGSRVPASAATNATQPVITTTSTAGVSVGTIVRLSGFAALPTICGTDFVVSAVTTNTNFTINTASNAFIAVPGTVNAGAGFYQIVYNPPLFYPARKVITNIIKASNTVTTATEHSLTVGQAIRFKIPAISGMIQLNPSPANNYLYATVLSITDAYSFVIDINTAAFTAFVWPTTALQPSDLPTYEPIGMNTAANYANASGLQQPQYQGVPIYNANTGVFADATINTGYYGMILGAGAATGAVLGAPIIGPAGTVTYSAGNAITAQDTMYWVAGKADFGGL